MKKYIKPLDNTKTNTYFWNIFWNAWQEQPQILRPVVKETYCGSKKPKTCTCWGCKGVRWKLFTYDDLNIDQLEISVLGRKY